MKLDNTPITIIKIKLKEINIFLFLYLFRINGIPFLLFMVTLHLVLFATSLIFLKFLIETFASTRVDLSLFIFHSNIFFAIHIFINLSTKYPSTTILT